MNYVSFSLTLQDRAFVFGGGLHSQSVLILPWSHLTQCQMTLFLVKNVDVTAKQHIFKDGPPPKCHTEKRLVESQTGGPEALLTDPWVRGGNIQFSTPPQRVTERRGREREEG